VAVFALGGCGLGSGDDLGQLRRQAHDALARYDKAMLDAGGPPRFVPVGGLTGQLGDWEPTNENGKRALLSGRVFGATVLPDTPPVTGTVAWDNGLTQTFPLLSARDSLVQLNLTAPGTGDCPECVPLQVTGAHLTTVRIQTNGGPATAPAWEYPLKGTAVRVTRVAVGRSAVEVTPPSWDPMHAPHGIQIESAATTTNHRQLTVTFTGAVDPRSKPCGADYSAEAVESANAVVVIVIEHPHAAHETCPAVGTRRTTTVDLAQPLGERALLDVMAGLPVPVTITR
jgi:hypothetical protein